MALVRLLGPIDVIGDDGNERNLGSALRRTILALLGLHAGQVLSPDWLMATASCDLVTMGSR